MIVINRPNTRHYAIFDNRWLFCIGETVEFSYTDKR